MSNDTYYGMRSTDFINLIRRHGFSQVYMEEFPRRSRASMISFANEKFYIFWHDQNGILVCFESYTQSTDEEILSGGHAFYNWKPRDRKYIGKFESSGGYTENGIHIGYCGLADRLITRLKNFKMHGKFVKPWAENRYLWLAHSGDTPVQFDADFNCEALNERKIKKLPPHVQTVIGQ